MRQETLTGGANINLFLETSLAPFAGELARPEAIRVIFGESGDIEKTELFATVDAQGKPYAVLEASIVQSALIEFHIARAFFATAWAGRKEFGLVLGAILIDTVLTWTIPEDVSSLGLGNFEDLPKEPPRAAREAASRLAKALLVCNEISSLAELFQKTEAHRERASIRDFSIPVFGHILGMHAMGHVGGFEAFGIKTSDGDFVHHGETLPNVSTKDTLAIPMLDIPHLESISPSALFCAP
jgi:hypothetical protein